MNVTKQNAVGALERVLIGGDLKELSAEDRLNYYSKVCESVGLNPLTKPFEYITLNGRLTLYARKDATDQLRSIHGISVIDMTESEREGVFVVTVKVQNAQGRIDMAKGAVNINGLRGEALANALMKAETKAKRRATLSLCGLGMLDETEVADIPADQKAPASVAAAKVLEKVAPKAETPRAEVPKVVIDKAAEDAEEYYPDQDDVAPEAPKAEAPKAKKTNSAGVAYPVPPEEIITLLKQKRPLKFLQWAESIIADGQVIDSAAFAKDFAAAEKMLRENTPQLNRWRVAMGKIGVEVE